jgi:hypothetical protein
LRPTEPGVRADRDQRRRAATRDTDKASSGVR